MKKAAAPTTPTASGKQAFTVSALGLELLDTTWRIAVPVLLFAAGGIFADIKLDTKPWLTLSMVIVGFIFAGILVKKQIDAVTKEEDK
jgi:F0F1-type ATP synthase assembly protein I